MCLFLASLSQFVIHAVSCTTYHIKCYYSIYVQLTLTNSVITWLHSLGFHFNLFNIKCFSDFQCNHHAKLNCICHLVIFFVNFETFITSFSIQMATCGWISCPSLSQNIIKILWVLNSVCRWHYYCTDISQPNEICSASHRWNTVNFDLTIKSPWTANKA